MTKDLERFNIVQKGLLYLRPEATVRDALLGLSGLKICNLWTNDNMYKHLVFLASSFMVKVCFHSLTQTLFRSLCRRHTSSRMAVDYFFRSTAMVPPPQKVIAMLENKISAVHLRYQKWAQA